LQLTATDQLVVAVGNLYPVKGHTYLVEALALLANRFPRLHVAIAGRGELQETILTQACRLNVADRLHLLGLRSDIGNVLAAADVFVLPSLSEGVPLALLEAMLAARPIIATAVGEIPTVLDGGRAGVVVRASDATGLADALAGLLSDPIRARRLGDAAAARASESYTLSSMVDRYVALYEKALAPARGADPQLESLQIADPKASVSR
jgi:glycosyltransferase involved in cell wall biosynthesis